MTKTARNCLRQLREARELTQWKLAFLASVNQATVSLIETEEYYPSRTTRQKLTVTLGVLPRDIWPDGGPTEDTHPTSSDTILEEATNEQPVSESPVASD